MFYITVKLKRKGKMVFGVEGMGVLPDGVHVVMLTTIGKYCPWSDGTSCGGVDHVTFKEGVDKH